MTITKALIYAAAMDAAKRSIRKRGLSVMDDDTNDIYHAEFDHLFAFIGGPEGWMALPNR